LQIAEQSFGRVIRQEKLREHRSEHNPEAYYFLAEVLKQKAKRDDVELEKKQRLLLQAASLYNFVMNCLKLDSVEKDSVKTMSQSLPSKMKDVEDSLVSNIEGNLDSCVFNPDEKKNYLKQLREDVKEMLSSLEQSNHDNGETNENRLRDAFVKQTEDVKRICKMISSRIKQLFSQIIGECLEILGKPPCEYEVLVLGSLSRNEMTPYSDIEWAILIGSEEEQCKVFFRNLTNLVHLQVCIFS
jgi:predicted nucleotidyltransferase